MAVDQITLSVSSSVDQPTQLAFKSLQGKLDTLVSQINRALAGEAVSAGSTYAVGFKDAGKTILLDTVTGSVATMLPATGSRSFYHFMVSVVATSNSHKIQVTGTDIMQGLIFSVSDGSNNAIGWRTADDSDTITLDRSTMGSVERGEKITLFDAAAGLWLVNGFTASTGTEASPFSAAVS